MSEDLREQLALTLLKIYSRHAPDRDQMQGTVIGFISEDARESFLRMAAECLRQMEWARLSGCSAASGREPYSPTEIVSLAPEDWKP